MSANKIWPGPSTLVKKIALGKQKSTKAFLKETRISVNEIKINIIQYNKHT
jgi:tRNA A37 threonylcarbamoyladenosine synthetase subunit TsaC/SUA5/YrdC